MRAAHVDPRDQRWEDDSPAYRVYFWTGDSSCEEWQLTGADVDEVLAWADEHADGRTMSIWVVRSDADGVGLIRLAGVDPTADPSTWPSWAAPRG
jgi:hypothetical protein